MPVCGTSHVRKKSQDSQKVVRREEQLIGRDVKASGCEVEIRVEIERCSTE